MRVPVAQGEAVYVGVALVVATGTDEVVLEAVEAEGAEGGLHFVGPVGFLDGETRWVGAAAERDVVAAGIDLASYMPVAGVRLQATEGAVALMVRATCTAPIYGFRSVVLRFRVNGGSVLTERFPIRASI